MAATLGDFVVNELVYLLSNTDETTPWTQGPEIPTEHWKIEEACT